MGVQCVRRTCSTCKAPILVRSVSAAVDIPIIAHGGAGRVDDIGEVVRDAGASAAAVGSMVVFQKQGMGVLVNFPSADQLSAALQQKAHDKEPVPG